MVLVDHLTKIHLLSSLAYVLYSAVVSSLQVSRRIAIALTAALGMVCATMGCASVPLGGPTLTAA